jgi:hypothetical protein
MELIMNRTILHTLLILYFVSPIPVMSYPNPKPFYLYILTGQSNMEGLGLVEALPDSLRIVQSGVYIYHPNRLQDNTATENAGYWEALRPGHGSGYYTDGENGKVLKWVEIIQDAQKDFAEADGNSAILYPSAGHGWLDPWHYDSKTYLELGVRFADEIYRLQQHAQAGNE